MYRVIKTIHSGELRYTVQRRICGIWWWRYTSFREDYAIACAKRYTLVARGDRVIWSSDEV